jgi:hypothetical protein
MRKLSFKKIIQILFFAVVTVAVLAQLSSVYSRWRIGREIRAEIWRGAQVTVLKTDSRFPPSLLLAYANTSQYSIAESRFKLTFTLGTEVVASAEREFREVPSGATDHVLLESVRTATAEAPPPPGTKLAYHLLVYPGQRKPLPQITGEIEIR